MKYSVTVRAISMPVRRAVDGQLYFAATDVPSMLRHIAASITLHTQDDAPPGPATGRERTA
ncbi:hypothetical protein J7F03_39360 [Streptomyces sp. ISL-43]|uniref:hypothetical protein n=1 Tax=Streptomyces sp. ISL-43 TaxID=2819183 RepID=UPI001BE7449B|nr:hypothetical protein [Streptomyces sp. ISL-43]MBT2452984.1 hypothetical protein [Streptomyces sp. ISL-43]